jgi:hypothetical protein
MRHYTRDLRPNSVSCWTFRIRPSSHPALRSWPPSVMYSASAGPSALQQTRRRTAATQQFVRTDNYGCDVQEQSKFRIYPQIDLGLHHCGPTRELNRPQTAPRSIHKVVCRQRRQHITSASNARADIAGNDQEVEHDPGVVGDPDGWSRCTYWKGSRRVDGPRLP